MTGNYIKKLPDAYCKESESTNARLLKIDEDDIVSLRGDIRAVSEALDLFNANGGTLNLYGDMVGQKRGQLDDTRYRYMILTRIGANLVQGDYKSIMANIVQMFGCGQEDVTLNDVEITEEDEPCTVYLSKMPIAVLVSAGFTSFQAVRMIEMLLPVCVKLKADNFEGTFCFADSNEEYDELAGFADDLQTFGGYLGLLLGEDEETPLPI